VTPHFSGAGYPRSVIQVLFSPTACSVQRHDAGKPRGELREARIFHPFHPRRRKRPNCRTLILPEFWDFSWYASAMARAGAFRHGCLKRPRPVLRWGLVPLGVLHGLRKEVDMLPGCLRSEYPDAGAGRCQPPPSVKCQPLFDARLGDFNK
jgi:hypothetical protein